MPTDGTGLTSNSICMGGGNVFWNINSYLESAFVILNLDMFYSPHFTIVQQNQLPYMLDTITVFHDHEHPTLSPYLIIRPTSFPLKFDKQFSLSGKFKLFSSNVKILLVFQYLTTRFYSLVDCISCYMSNSMILLYVTKQFPLHSRKE